MTEAAQSSLHHRLAGYAELIDRYDLTVIPNWHKSRVAMRGSHRVVEKGGMVDVVYPPAFWPGDSLGDHLEFALKYDGTNLAILDSLFEATEEEELLEYIRSKPTGKFARRLWYLYELLTGKRLPLNDVKQGNYVELLNPDEYYTSASGDRIRRQRIINNLMGDRRFCPMVRRTETLRELEEKDLPRRCEKVVTGYSAKLLSRAVNHLYNRETKSTFEIEHIEPDSTKTERFAVLLRQAHQEDFCEKTQLIKLQNDIVDPRFQDSDYRLVQIYVGETVTWQQEKIHFIGPKPEDLADLMEGLVGAHQRMGAGGVPVVIHAAAVAYGFVFLHPFGDGNGRIHRFLIHNILAQQGFTPKGIIFPVSASMLENSVSYDASLEAFSRNLQTLVDYSLDDEGSMTVHNDTVGWYRYIDMTPQAEALFRFIEQTIEKELVPGLAFLLSYDRAKAAIQEIADMPGRENDLFIRFCRQNNYRLSARKRESHFNFLTDEEVGRMEEAVSSAYDGPVVDA